MRKRQFLFRLFYSTSFSVFLIIEILLLLISPGDIIYQSFAADRRLSVVAIAIVYVAVLLISAFIIATRFYTAHTQLTAIPKSHVPIRKEDLSRSLHKLISSEVSRSAAIAYHARPQNISSEELHALGEAPAKTTTIPWPTDHMKSWMEIQHPGWSSPCAPDLPDLQFEPVLLEFPNLLEAEAVSLLSANQSIKVSLENGFTASEFLDLLQRPLSMSLRGYFDRLVEFGMLDRTDTTNTFIQDYERLRFSKTPVSEEEFHRILGGFTQIIQSLRVPSQDAIRHYFAQEEPQEMKLQFSDASLRQTSLLIETTAKKQHQASYNENKQAPSLLPSRSSRRFLAAQTHGYQASLSSGHAGDRSSDSENDLLAHAPSKRSTKLSRVSVEPDTIAARNQGSGMNHDGDIEIDGNPQPDLDNNDDGGSVIRRSVTNRTDRSVESSVSRRSLGSVIWREDQGEPTLPLPLADDTG